MQNRFEAPVGALAIMATISAFVVAGCASTTVTSSREASSQRPSEYSTFRVNEPEVGQTDAELSRALARGLEEKGYRPDGEDAELVVTYKLLLGSIDEPSSEPPAIVHDDMFSRPLPADARETKILLVLIQDARTLDTLWVGWSHAETREEDVERRARSALDELVKQIPSREEASGG